MLAIFKNDDKNFQLMQTSWAQKLNPVINSPLNNGIFLPGIILINGTTVINHLLGRVQQGWMITDINGVASIYRSAPFNNQTLSLHSSAAVTVNLYVF